MESLSSCITRMLSAPPPPGLFLAFKYLNKVIRLFGARLLRERRLCMSYTILPSDPPRISSVSRNSSTGSSPPILLSSARLGWLE